MSQSNHVGIIASSDRRYVGKGETLVPFVSIICYSCVVEPWDEHYHTQNCKENACIQKTGARDQVKNTKSIFYIDNLYIYCNSFYINATSSVLL